MKKIALIPLAIPALGCVAVPLFSCAVSKKITGIVAELSKEPLVGNKIEKSDIKVYSLSQAGKKEVHGWSCSEQLPILLDSLDRKDIVITYNSYKTQLSISPKLPADAITINFVANDGGRLEGKTTVYPKKGTTFGDLYYRPTAVAKSNWAFSKWIDEDGNQIQLTTPLNSDITIHAVFDYLNDPTTAGLKFSKVYGESRKVIGYRASLDEENMDRLPIDDNGTYVFPKEYNGDAGPLPVLEINDGAFKSRFISSDASTVLTRINKIVISNTIKRIMTSAFENENLGDAPSGKKLDTIGNLTEIQFEGDSTLNFIGNASFSGCTKLKEIVFPKTVSMIEEYAFKMESLSGTAPALSKIEFQDNTESGFKLTISRGAFSGCINLKKVELPNTIKSLSGFDYTGIQSISIPENIETIERECFKNSSLIKIAFNGDNLKSIGNQAFYECHSLETIAIPKGVTEIGVQAFKGSGLQAIDFDVDSALKILLDEAFSETFLTSIELPDSVESIRNKAFENCTKLTEVYFTEKSNLKYIGSAGTGKVFNGCPGLTSFTVPSKIESFSSQVFGYKDGSTTELTLTNLTFANQNDRFYSADKTLKFTPSDDPAKNAKLFAEANHDCYLTAKFNITYQVHESCTEKGTITAGTGDKLATKNALLSEVSKAKTVAKSGYEFKYWADKDGNELSDDTVISSDTTLYAWFE